MTILSVTVGRRIASFVQKRDRNDKPSEKTKILSHAYYVRVTRDSPWAEFSLSYVVAAYRRVPPVPVGRMLTSF